MSNTITNYTIEQKTGRIIEIPATPTRHKQEFTGYTIWNLRDFSQTILSDNAMDNSSSVWSIIAPEIWHYFSPTQDELYNDICHYRTRNSLGQLTRYARVKGKLNTNDMSNMTIADGICIDNIALANQHLSEDTSKYKFPQEKPTEDNWDTWNHSGNSTPSHYMSWILHVEDRSIQHHTGFIKDTDMIINQATISVRNRSLVSCVNFRT